MLKRYLAAFAALTAAAGATRAQDLQTVDQAIEAALSPVSDFIAGIIFYSVPVAGTEFPMIVGWLIIAGTIFTLYFGFHQFRGFGHAIALTRGDYSDKHKREPGETSHFQALSMALSGTVGLGNIAGVAVAVSIGGAGATFWMILAGLLGMASKFTECTLGLKYRNHNPDGSVSGGPMYYLSKGLAERGMAGLGKVLAVVFAICCIGGAVGGGNMFQANQAYQQVVNVTGGADSILAGRGWVFGLILASVVALVIIGGVRSIARVTSRVVPFMAILYVGT
ncbi:MAG TPA: alanine:cation symporter family protein, partial [Noviherbaspirillum sp.]|nr:alanine:cation symporter family protein [Noviherbaspirillum sp.]